MNRGPRITRIITDYHGEERNRVIRISRVIRRYAFLVFFVLCFLTTCTKNANLASDGGGDSQNKVLRVISAAPSYTEIIAGLGLADTLIAVDPYSRDVDGVRNDLPEMDFFYPDIEAIVALKPDLIICGEINTGGSSAQPYEFFASMNITVIRLPTCNSIEEIYRDIARIANALNVAEKGEVLIRRMKEQIAEIAAHTANAAETASAVSGAKRVYFEIAPPPNVVSFGGGTYLDEMITLAGGRNIFTVEKRWFTPGPEAIISANPEVIFFIADESAGTPAAQAAAASAAAAATTAEIKSRPGFATLSAVRHNRVYPINANSASRPSQNIVLALEEMYRAIND